MNCIQTSCATAIATAKKEKKEEKEEKEKEEKKEKSYREEKGAFAKIYPL